MTFKCLGNWFTSYAKSELDIEGKIGMVKIASKEHTKKN